MFSREHKAPLSSVTLSRVSIVLSHWVNHVEVAVMGRLWSPLRGTREPRASAGPQPCATQDTHRSKTKPTLLDIILSSRRVSLSFFCVSHLPRQVHPSPNPKKSVQRGGGARGEGRFRCCLRPMTWGGGEGKVNEAKYVAGPGVREKEKISLTDYPPQKVFIFDCTLASSGEISPGSRRPPRPWTWPRSGP